MTDAETIEAARRLFASDTPGDKLARRLLAIAERERAENQPLRNLLSPLRDAVLFARSQRRPMGIGQDFPRAPACVSIQLGAAYGRERDCVGFWIESDEIAPEGVLMRVSDWEKSSFLVPPGSVILTRTEADALRDLLEFVRCGWVGPHAQTIRMLRGKVAK